MMSVFYARRGFLIKTYEQEDKVSEYFLAGFNILFFEKVSEKIEYLAKNAGIFLPLSGKFLDVET